MPSKTLGDKVDELLQAMAVATHRLDKLEVNVSRLTQEQSEMYDSIAELTTRLTLLEHQFAEMKKANEERDRRLWMIGGSLFVAIIGAILTFLLRK